jgi:hypothetical protein
LASLYYSGDIMSLFALILNGTIVQVDAAIFPVAPALSWTTDISAIVPQPQVGWAATDTGGAWAFTAPPAPPAPSNAQLAAVELATQLAAGIVITSTSLPAVDGTYALDSVSTAQIYQIGLFGSQFGTFPSGGATQVYPDINSAPHIFTVPVFVAFLKAVAPLVSAYETQAGIMAQGGSAIWPPNAATIA